MTMAKTEKYIISDLTTKVTLPSFRHDSISGPAETSTKGGTQHVLWVDTDNVPGCFYSEYMWHFPPLDGTKEHALKSSPDPHIHPFDQVIGFVGTNQDDNFDLGGEVEITLEKETFNITRSFLVFIPAGMGHCPIRIKRMDRPIFQYVLGSAVSYSGSAKDAAATIARSELERHFVFSYKKGLVHPEYLGKSREEPGVHFHIAYLDGEVVPGAKFYVEASWFGNKPRPAPKPGEPLGPQPHTHPFAEIITFFGTNPDDVHDLGGEAELWIDKQQHILTRSFVAYVPAGVEHCPLILRKIERPIFHFSAGPGAMYI
jgi:hypothetical protein